MLRLFISCAVFAKECGWILGPYGFSEQVLSCSMIALEALTSYAAYQAM